MRPRRIINLGIGQVSIIVVFLMSKGWSFVTPQSESNSASGSQDDSEYITDDTSPNFTRSAFALNYTQAADDDSPKFTLECYVCSYSTIKPGVSDKQTYCLHMERDDKENQKYLKPVDPNTYDLYVNCVTIRGKDAEGNTIYVERKIESSKKPKNMCDYMRPEGALFEHLDAAKWSTCRCDDRAGCNDDALMPSASVLITANYFLPTLTSFVIYALAHYL